MELALNDIKFIKNIDLHGGKCQVCFFVPCYSGGVQEESNSVINIWNIFSWDTQQNIMGIFAGNIVLSYLECNETEMGIHIHYIQQLSSKNGGFFCAYVLGFQ